MDIVERLRDGANFYAESSLWYDRDLADAVDEAADEIERLREVLALWSGDGSLQTFEDRERFRKAARAALKTATATP